ncbi:MAG: hypothetical protein KDE02_14480 [Rhodobacteraceae bacterium]|nr:hypothetical protein [Paracoccaceae bacterium]MCB2140800.1 hypothetical protein [Paracoccaceae bacterium]MCB2143967.1 hypothetical protein [Paracoccaceae bacterium]
MTTTAENILGDDLLKLWVALVETQPEREGPSVILFVSGTMISGRIISAKKFFEVSHMQDLYKELTDGLGDDDDPAPLERRFVHLIDPKIFRGREVPIELDGSAWRGRISEVSGFMFGQLAAIAA